MTAEEIRIAALEAALRGLLDAVQAMLDDGSFKARESIASLHGYEYAGPHPDGPMKVARRLLETACSGVR
ncbi:MAG: hypothetical protein ABIJ73_10015 [Pseudomonadota bacterium]